MKTLYIECNMGAAGDMLMSALSELIPDPDGFIEKMNGLGLPGVVFERKPSTKCGIVGTHISVKVRGHEEGHHHHDHDDHHHHHDHHHSGLSDIRHIISHLDVSENVRRQAASVYNLIAQAESTVHGLPVENIHFHEVGSLDAVADVVGVCQLMEMIAPDRVIVSPVHVGSGHVRCMHGILPVPTPAMALLLAGVPTYGGAIRGELCTPTGAALLRQFAHGFGEMPIMNVEKIGYGMGNKDFECANCVRVMLGSSGGNRDEVVEISCNLDDMTGEDLAWAAEKMRDEGALDVYMTSIQMKKNRPGVMLSCLCRAEDEEKFAMLMLKHTTTIGVRCRKYSRYVLDREIYTVETENGPARMKRSFGFGIEKTKMEADDRLK